MSLRDKYGACNMNAAVSDDSRRDGRMVGGFGFGSRPQSAQSPGQKSGSSSPMAELKRHYRWFGRNDASSPEAAMAKDGHSDDRSETASNSDGLKHTRQDPELSEAEYIKRYRRARRQLWVWRIVSYLLIAAVVGESCSMHPWTQVHQVPLEVLLMLFRAMPMVCKHRSLSLAFARLLDTI